MRIPLASWPEKLIDLAEVRESLNKGIAQESQVVFDAFEDFLEYYLQPISREWDRPPLERFIKLRDEWQRDTEFLSSIHAMISHPAYLQIIGMGPVAVPLLINELQNEPDYWFPALKAITGCDPVPPDKRGDLQAMTKVWLEWWRVCDLREEPVCKAALSSFRRF
ncbi:MAG: hypothetical protein ABSG35_23655 [Syntrophobacteraceae bacterium]|jgi:hypothetical protein